MYLKLARAALAYSVMLVLPSALLMGCGSEPAPTPADDPAALQIGLMTDTHYAQDCRSGIPLCDQTITYAEAVLQKMKDEGLTWVAHNGDNKDETADPDIYADQAIARQAALGYAADIEFTLQASFPDKVVHVLGNHDMDRLTKDEFLSAINEASGFYSRHLGGGVSAVVIDGTYDAEGRDFSTMSCQDNGTGCDEGYGSWQFAHVPDFQVSWLRDTLAAERTAGNKVLVFSHFRLDGDRDLETDAWLSVRILVNSAEVRGVLEEFKSTVLAVFHGHDHRAVDSPRVVNGIGYYTLVAMVEALEAEKAPWATIKVWPQACRVQILGHGEVPISACGGEAWCVNRTLVPFSVDWKHGELGDADCGAAQAVADMVV